MDTVISKTERVHVSEVATGVPGGVFGTVEDVRDYFGTTLYLIKLDQPDESGNRYVTISKASLIKRIITQER